MRTRLAGMALALSWAAWAGAVGCGGSSGGTGSGGHGGGGKAGGTAGGTAGSTAGSTGTAGGAAGAAAGSTGTAGGAAGGTAGAAGNADGGAGTGGSTGTAGADAAVDGPAAPFPEVTIPDAIAVPTGATLKFRAHGRGNQVYTCTGTTTAVDAGADAGDAGTTTTYAWVAVPDAKLYDQNNAQIGTHFAGPTWMSTADESDAVGVKDTQSAGATANDIPWLRLKVVSHMGSGVFTDVTWVQRLNTSGGVAPSTACTSANLGTVTPVAYTADYYFYTGGVTTPDGGAPAQWPFATIASIPDTIAAPAGTTLKLRLHGWGDQVYTCTASGGADAGADAGAPTYSWVATPMATLYDDTDTKQGTHSAGPTWTANDTSSIVGMKQFGVNAPTTDAIQWLLLKVTSHAGATGTFSDVTYVQRLNTSKGVAPATGCDSTHVNAVAPVAYSADYYYYTGTPTTDAGTDSTGN